MQKHEEWFFIASEDLRSAQVLKDEKLFTTALYHTQQCAEKALKGYLTFKKQPIKKIHDLVVLIEECCKFDITFSELFNRAANLKPYITQSRYPDDYVEADESDVVVALEDANYIFAFVKKKLVEK